MRLAALLSLSVVAAACAASAPKSSTDVATIAAQIDSLDAQFNRWANSNQLDSIIARYYAADAVLLSPGAPAARGSDAIRALYKGLFDAGTLRGSIKRTAIVAADSVAADIGQYTFEIRSKTDSTKVIFADHGTYETSFVRRNGEWRAIYDANATDIPPVPPPAPKGATKK